MATSGVSTRWLVALLSALMIFQAGAVSPALVLGQEPSPAPAESPAPATDPVSPTPSPVASPTPVEPSPRPEPNTTPTPEPSPTPEAPQPPATPPTEPADPRGVERLDMRTASSRTFEQADGSFATEFYAEDIHYKPEDTSDWQPIDALLSAVAGPGTKARNEHAPARLSLAAADHAAGFATLEGGGHTIRFRLPPGALPGRAATEPVIKEDGLFADYADFLPGGIGLRVFPEPDGFKAFLVLPSRPAVNSFTFAIDAPGLTLADEGDGSFAFRNRAGNVVGRIPRPFAMDSSEVEGRGGGLYSEAVTMSVTSIAGPLYLVTLSVDPAFLDSAVYPVYIDPTTSDFPDGTATTAADTFASEKYPGSNFNTYQRPDSPYHKEMWHGNEPGTGYYNEVYIRFDDLAATLGDKHVEQAHLEFYPYWQYYHNDPRKSWLKRVTSPWDASTLKWNLRPSVQTAETEFYTTEDVWSHTPVTDYVQDILNGDWTDHGLMIHNNHAGQGSWKRIVSRNNATLKPHLTVTWHSLAAGPAKPANNAWNGRTLTWSYTSLGGLPQSHYRVQVATSDTFTTIVRETSADGVASGANNWTFAASGTPAMTHATSYWWRVRVKDGAAWTAWSAPAQFTYDTSAPVANFTTPDEGTTTLQSATSYTVAWAESDTGSGPAKRSLQRQRGSIVTPGTCADVDWTDDDVAQTGTTGFIGAAEQETWWAEPYNNVTMPADMKVGDQLLALVGVGRDRPIAGQTTVTPPAGWTLVTRSDYLSDAAPSEYLLYIKVATAADAGQQTWAVSPNRGFGVYILAYRGLRYERRTGPTTLGQTGTPTNQIALPNVSLAPGQHAIGMVGSGYWYGQWFASLPSGWTQRLAMGAMYFNQSGFLERPSVAGENITGPNVTITTTDGAHRRVAWSVVLTPGLAAPEPENETGLASGNCYRWRQTLTDRAGNTGSATSGSVLVDVSLENGGRGEESYYTRVPFDLGGDWRMAVGVHNGELTLDRHLFEIPSYGPPQSLSLSYSSLNTASAYFGTGWSSNLTQRLSFDTNLVRWHRADGGIVHFTLVGGTWTPTVGHFETLTAGTGEYTVTLKDQTRLVFEGSGQGRLKRIENRFGKALTLVWNTSSATATDASGRVTNMVISGGLITSATDSAGRQWQFGYTSGRLTTVTDPAGKATTLVYTSGLLTSINRTRTPASGPAETITWSVAYTGGKVTGVTDPVNSSVANTFTYTSSQATVGFLKQYSPVLRNTWTYSFDGLGRVTSALDPEGYTTSYTYDANSNLTQLVLPISTSPVTNQSISYTYDTRANVLTQTSQLTATTNVVTKMSYNATNDLLTRSEADNDASLKLVTKYTYDGSGRLTSVNVNCTTSGTTPPADAGTCTGAGTQNSSTNLITTYTYTANHQLELETDPMGRVTKHVYDSHGNETQTIANFVSLGGATADQNVSTTYGYSSAGLATSMTDPLEHTTTYTYDVLGRQTTEILPGDASIPALTRSTTYDEFGNALTETEAWAGVPDRVITHEYDKANRETKVTDPAGVQSTTSYDAAGNAISSTSGGVTTTLIFDGLGRMSAQTVQSATTSHLYDGQGRETQMVDPEGVETDRVYDLGGRVTSETVLASPANLVTTYVYDLLGRQASTASPDGVITATSYDRPGRTIFSTTAGATTTYANDRGGNETSSTDPDGVVTTTTYDPLNRPTIAVANDVAVPDESTEDVTTTTFYDAAGRTIAVRDDAGISTRSIYNVRGLVKQSIANCTDTGTTPTTDPPNCTGQGTHDATTNVITTTSYDGSGAPTIVVVAQGTGASATIEYAYDAAGRQQAVKDPRGTVTRTLYDSAGRVTTTIVNCTEDLSNPSPPSGSWWACDGSTLNDGTWNVTTSRTYDARGNVASETAPNGRITTYVYDDADRLIQRIDNDVAGTPTSPDQDISTYYAYDDAGRQSAIRGPTVDRNTFAVTRFVYDADGHLVQEIRSCTDSGNTPPGDPAWKTCSGNGARDADTNLVTEYGYDSRNNPVSVSGADPSATSGTSVATVITRYAFDDQNRLCGVLENATVPLATPDPCVSPGGGTATQNTWTHYTYDGMGNMTSMVDARGNTTHYGYDGSGRMISMSEPINNSDPSAPAVLAGTTTWTYDDLGRRVNQSRRGQPSQTSVSWMYDAASRMTSRTGGPGTPEEATTTYGYDDNGNRTSATSPGSAITTTYDRLSRPLTVSVTGDNAGTTTYTYNLTAPSWTDPSGFYVATLDKFDHQLTLTDPIHGSTQFSWSYRADGQLATMAAPNGNTATFGYDDAGAASSKVTTNSSGLSVSYGWSRNRAGHVLSEETAVSVNTVPTSDPINGTTTYSYDPLGRLSSFGRGGPTTTYGWQAVPNRDSVKVGTDPAVTFEFDAANRETMSSMGNIDYDDEGRLYVRPGQILVWNDLGQLTAVKDAATQVVIAAYTYDALDRLLVVDGGTTEKIRFRYVGQTTQVAQVVDHDAADAVIARVGNDWSGTRLFEWTSSSQTLFGTNGHHDVSWTANASGGVSATLLYDPWGNLAASSGSDLPDFRFQGSWFDPSVELSWVVTRWYAPQLGRFISEDSLLGDPADPPTRHLYAYGLGNSIARHDPVGQYSYLVTSDRSLANISGDTIGNIRAWKSIMNANRGTLSPFLRSSSIVRRGTCLTIPINWILITKRNPTLPRQVGQRCSGAVREFRIDLLEAGSLATAQRTASKHLTKWGDGVDWILFNFGRADLINMVDETSAKRPKWVGSTGLPRVAEANRNAERFIRKSQPRRGWVSSLWLVDPPDVPCFEGFGRRDCAAWGNLVTVGQYIFLNGGHINNPWLKAHEYIHVVQWEGRGMDYQHSYLWWLMVRGKGGAEQNPEEAPAYLWQWWIKYFPKETLPWHIWHRPGERPPRRGGPL